MARDIEEFLRRAAERRQQHLKGGQPVPPAGPPADTSAIPTAERVQSSPSERSSSPNKTNPNSGRQTQPAPSPQPKSNKSERKPQRKTTTKKSPIFPSTPSVGQHADDAKGTISGTSQKFDQQIFQHLDHEQQRLIQVGKSERKQQAGSKESNIPMTGQLRKMLSQPETIAQAILISEIIKRPTFDDDDT